MALWLILLLVGLFALIFGPRAALFVFGPLFLFTAGVSGEVSIMPPEDNGGSIHYPVVLESAYVNVSPVGHVELHVTGYFPDGCDDLPLEMSLGRIGNSITIELRRWGLETVDCPAVITPYEDVIPLDVALQIGTYTLTVNDLFLEFVIPDPNAPVSSDDPTSANPTPPPPEGSRVDGVVENVEVMVLESYPMQLLLHVTGYHTDGCEIPIYIDQTRDGNTVTVGVYRVMTSRMSCPAVLQPFELDIKLEGGFESGAYTIHVNEYVVPLEL